MKIERLTSAHASSEALSTLVPSDTIAQLLEMSEGGGVAFVAILKGIPVGFASIMPTGEFMAIVLPAFQRVGIGTALGEHALEAAFRERAMKKVWATASTGHRGASLAKKLRMRVVRQSFGEDRFELSAAGWREMFDPGT
jgi:GNAT superfamily N-acetyltransferase